MASPRTKAQTNEQGEDTQFRVPKISPPNILTAMASVKPDLPSPITPPVSEESDSLIQGLTPGQLSILAQKVYDLWLDELRIEDERSGRRKG